MMVSVRKRLPASVVNDCNELIVRHGPNVIRSPDASFMRRVTTAAALPAVVISPRCLVLRTISQSGQPVDRRHVHADTRCPDLSLLNEAGEVTEKLIDAMNPQVTESFGDQPRKHRTKARQQIVDRGSSRRLLRYSCRSDLASAQSARPFSSRFAIWSGIWPELRP